MSDPELNGFQTPFRLSDTSAEQVDRVLAHRSGAAFGAPAQSDETAGAAGRLLALLDAPPVDGPALLADGSTVLLDVTMARVLRARRAGAAGVIGPIADASGLTEASAAAVDQLVDSGWRTAPRELALIGAIEAPLTPESDEARTRRIDAVLSRIQLVIDGEGRRFRLDAEHPATMGSQGGFRLSDLVALAAMLLVAVGVMWPIVASVREEARQRLCSANLGRAATGFSLYAADHDGELPQARASFLGGTWWDVGRSERSHSANLYTLVGQRYSSLADLACPGNPYAPVELTNPEATDWRHAREVSFSYQLPSSPRPKWNLGSAILVLSDRSPVVARARLGERFDSNASSANHEGHGQNLLFSDGSVRFHLTPILENGDNIWLPGSIGPAGHRATLTGRETPESSNDAFVGP